MLKELIINILAALLFLIALFIVIFGIGNMFHKIFFEDEEDYI